MCEAKLDGFDKLNIFNHLVFSRCIVPSPLSSILKNCTNFFPFSEPSYTGQHGGRVTFHLVIKLGEFSKRKLFEIINNEVSSLSVRMGLIL